MPRYNYLGHVKVSLGEEVLPLTLKIPNDQGLMKPWCLSSRFFPDMLPTILHARQADMSTSLFFLCLHYFFESMFQPWMACGLGIILYHTYPYLRSFGTAPPGPTAWHAASVALCPAANSPSIRFSAWASRHPQDPRPRLNLWLQHRCLFCLVDLVPVGHLCASSDSFSLCVAFSVLVIGTLPNPSMVVTRLFSP